MPRWRLLKQDETAVSLGRIINLLELLKEVSNDQKNDDLKALVLAILHPRQSSGVAQKVRALGPGRLTTRARYGLSLLLVIGPGPFVAASSNARQMGYTCCTTDNAVELLGSVGTQPEKWWAQLEGGSLTKISASITRHANLALENIQCKYTQQLVADLWGRPVVQQVLQNAAAQCPLDLEFWCSRVEAKASLQDSVILPPDSPEAGHPSSDTEHQEIERSGSQISHGSPMPLDDDQIVSMTTLVPKGT
jgi:hypothetical protein